jgi:type IV pilus assembly protein PilE
MDMSHQTTECHGQQSRKRGFTLIELMIVVAIIAIIAAVALPSYFGSIRKSRRADAITALNKIAQEQERWRANNSTYSNVLSSAGLNVANPSSGFYTLGVTGNTATVYVATATAAGAQTSDAKCTTLTLTMNGGNITYGATPAANANLCWNR